MHVYTVPQLAKLFQVKTDTVRAWIVSNRLSALNLALPGKRGQYRITQEQLDEFIRRCTIQKPEPRKSRRKDSIPFRRYS